MVLVLGRLKGLNVSFTMWVGMELYGSRVLKNIVGRVCPCVDFRRQMKRK